MGIRLTLSDTIFSGLQKFLFSLANIFSLNMRDTHSLLNQAIEQQSSRTGGSTIKNVEPRYPVNIRIFLLSDKLAELRFWYNKKLIDQKRIKNEDILPVHF